MSLSTTFSPLRRALRLDAVASGTMGLALLVAAPSAQGLLGLPVAFSRVVGASLVPFAALLLWLASRPVPSRPLTMTIVVGNVAWVLASLVLLGSGMFPLTRLGVAFVIAQATAVAVFALLEHRALREAAEREAGLAAMGA